jgi:putative transcriptional regulator
MTKPAEIRSARELAGLTQSQAAEILGVDRVTWARYEAGTRTLSPEQWEYWLHKAGIARMPFKRQRSE